MRTFQLQSWSSNPVHPSFSLKLFLDTNILSYIVDGTYPSLNRFLSLLRETGFVQLVTSRYVIFEFVGIRKREHYLRKVADSSKKLMTGEVNFSSLLRYQNSFGAPNVSFDDIALQIKKSVDEEIELIAREHEVDITYSVVHDEQLQPTFELCLSTKIANQDSLVLISSVFPQPSIPSNNVHLLTNDGELINLLSQESTSKVFENLKMHKPHVIAINRVKTKTSTCDLTQVQQEDSIMMLIKAKVLELIKSANKSNFLGVTFTPRKELPEGVVCFKIQPNTAVPQNFYLSIISRDLDFVYSSPTSIDHIYHSNSPLPEGFKFESSTNKRNVSVRLAGINEIGKPISLSSEIRDALQQADNLVFIHPDTEKKH